MTEATTATLIPLDNVDPAMVEQVLDRAFGPDRFNRTAYKVREGDRLAPGAELRRARRGRVAGRHDPGLAGRADRSAQGKAPSDADGRPGGGRCPSASAKASGRALMLAIARRARSARAAAASADRRCRNITSASSASPPSRPAGWELPGPWERHRLLVRSERSRRACRSEGTLGPWLG